MLRSLRSLIVGGLAVLGLAMVGQFAAPGHALAQDAAPKPKSEPEAVAEAKPAPDAAEEGDVVGSITPAPEVKDTKLKAALAKPSPVVAQMAAVKPAFVKPTTSPAAPHRKLIVIDPGHGGIDPGAVSPKNTLEKDITFASAQALRDEIMALGSYDVKLTRDKDVFVSLEDRVAFARDNNADLFIAIHADTVHGPTVSGTTIYTLSDKGSDEEAEMLANTENNADKVAGIALAGQKEEIASLLVSLAQRDSRNRAGLFAKDLLGNLHDVTRMTGKPIRSAGFTVLKAPDIPSVLIELGYLSNAADEERMKSPSWQKMIAKSLAASVNAFFAPAAVATR